MDIDIEELIGGIGRGGGGMPRGTGFGSSPYGGGPTKQAKVQDKTIEKEVAVSLEEIAKGAEKKMKISRRIHHDDGRVSNEEKVLKINIKPGWKAGTNCQGEVIKPSSFKRLQGYGLPFPKEPSRRGDLIVKFEVLFPDSLTNSSKQTIYD